MRVELGELLGLGHTVAAATDAGLLEALAGGDRRPAEDWARSLKLDARATAAVLEVLVSCGAADRTDRGYAGSADLLSELERSPGGVAMAMLLWSSVGQFLRTGEPLFDMDGDSRARAAAYAGVVGSLGGLFEATAGALAQRLACTPREVLDVGCGSGVWGLALGLEHPEARVTGLDWPEVLTAFRERATAMGLESRTETIAGDMHTAELGGRRFDVAIVANVLRLEPPERAQSLLERLARALTPGGSLVIVDALAHGSREKDLARTLYGLHLSLRTRRGRVHEPEVVRGWMRAAGLEEISEIDLGVQPGAVAALVATRRTAP